MKTKFLSLAIIFFVALFFNLACENPEQPDTQSAEDDARGALVVSDAFAYSNSAASSDPGKSGIDTTGCFSIAFDGIYPDRVITMTFDSCVSDAGVVRDGQIIVNLNGEWGNGRQMTITFNSYSVDGVSVAGAITTTYNLIAENPSFNIKAENMVLTFTDDRTISWTSDKTYLMTAGMDTPFIQIDDIFLISGTSNGVNRIGDSYSTEYVDVEADKSCEWPKTGIVNITKAEEETTTFDFDQDGSAECDNIVKVTKGDITIYIEL